MSELIQKTDNRATIRWKLLTGASALALTAYGSSASLVNAEDGDRPQVWIELGGQFSRLQDGQEIYAPPFVNLTPAPFTSPQKSERPPLYGLDETAALTFRPEGSHWIFSASIRYGRAGSSKHVRHQSYPSPFMKYDITASGSKFYIPTNPTAARFTDVRSKQSEGHTIVDFAAGKDVGLGLFGAQESTFNVGVRIAQFQSKSRVSLHEDPDWHFSPQANHLPNGFVVQTAEQAFHSYAGSFSADRSFRGVGPSVSWSSSAPLAGNVQDGELALDFGVNGALLFGRQKARTRHHESARYHPLGGAHPSFYPSYPRYSVSPTLFDPVYQGASVDHTRSRKVTVPNVGGFAGISFNYSDAKVSLGYKADFFFGAIDGGIDTRKEENRGFFGPYASISIGLGD